MNFLSLKFAGIPRGMVLVNMPKSKLGNRKGIGRKEVEGTACSPDHSVRPSSIHKKKTKHVKGRRQVDDTTEPGFVTTDTCSVCAGLQSCFGSIEIHFLAKKKPIPAVRVAMKRVLTSA